MPEAPSDRLGFSQLVFSDLRRFRLDTTQNWAKVFARCLVEPGMIASVVVRAQQCLYRSGRVRLARVLRTAGVLLVGAEFVPGMTIGTGLCLPHPVGVVMGNDLVIGDNVTIAQGVTIGARIVDATIDQGYPTICDGAIVLARATIVGGVRVGKHAQVGANSLVVSDVPDFAVVLGVPARRIASREREAATSALLPPGARHEL